MSQKFCNILVHVSFWYIYPITEAVLIVVDSIMVVGVLIAGVLFKLHG